MYPPCFKCISFRLIRHSQRESNSIKCVGSRRERERLLYLLFRSTAARSFPSLFSPLSYNRFTQGGLPPQFRPDWQQQGVQQDWWQQESEANIHGLTNSARVPLFSRCQTSSALVGAARGSSFGRQERPHQRSRDDHEITRATFWYNSIQEEEEESGVRRRLPDSCVRIAASGTHDDYVYTHPAYRRYYVKCEANKKGGVAVYTLVWRTWRWQCSLTADDSFQSIFLLSACWVTWWVWWWTSAHCQTSPALLPPTNSPFLGPVPLQNNKFLLLISDRHLSVFFPPYRITFRRNVDT